jgi:hypothetical protein
VRRIGVDLHWGIWDVYGGLGYRAAFRTSRTAIGVNRGSLCRSLLGQQILLGKILAALLEDFAPCLLVDVVLADLLLFANALVNLLQLPTMFLL